jgi:hypothetical protein
VEDEQKLQRAFAAAMPLVQGPATVAKAEALLEAATGLDRKEAIDVVVRPSTNFQQICHSFKACSSHLLGSRKLPKGKMAPGPRGFT